MFLCFFTIELQCLGGKVVSFLMSSSLDREVLVCALAGDMLLSKTLNYCSASLHPGTANLILGGGITLRWTNIPSRGEWKYSSSLHATETGISCGPLLVCRLTILHILRPNSRKSLGNSCFNLTFNYPSHCSMKYS